MLKALEDGTIIGVRGRPLSGSLDKDGYLKTTYKGNNQRQFALDKGLNPANFYKLCAGIKKSYKGYKLWQS